MRQSTKCLLVACLLVAAEPIAVKSAERERVRIVINLMAGVKMPFPENLTRNKAKTQRVWLDHNGMVSFKCPGTAESHWCSQHIALPIARAEMLRIRNEPAAGIQVGQL